MSTWDIVRASIIAPNGDGVGLEVVLWGVPGIGKTTRYRALGASLGVHVEVLSPAARGEGAFGVLRVPEGVGDAMRLRTPPDDWFDTFGHGAQRRGILFLDEISSSERMIQAALLSALQERTFAGRPLGKRVVVHGAGNPLRFAAGGHDIAASLANRVCHLYDDGPSAEEHGDYMVDLADREGDGSYEEEDAPPSPFVGEPFDDACARVRARWASEFGASTVLYRGFVRSNPQLRLAPPEDDNDEKLSRAWPSPRTWEKAMRARAVSRIVGLAPVDVVRFVSGYVGEAAARQFFVWERQNDIPDLPSLLDGGTTFTHDPQRADRTVAVLVGCAGLLTVRGAVRVKERMDVMLELLAPIVMGPVDLAVPAARRLAIAGLLNTPQARALLERLAPALSAAGVQARSPAKAPRPASVVRAPA